jgi:hypothetical protein
MDVASARQRATAGSLHLVVRLTARLVVLAPLLAPLLAIAAAPGCRAPRSTASMPAPMPTTVPLRGRFEVVFDVPARTVAPDDVAIDARFSSPSGKVSSVGGFASHGGWVVRFAPREVGRFTYVIRADGGTGAREVARGELDVVPSQRPGFVRIDARDRHRLVRDTGEPVYVLGENRINVYDRSWNYENVDTPTYLSRMAAYGMSTIRVFVFSDCESETTRGGYQIGCLEPSIGRFDERTADALDVLFRAADDNAIDVVLVAFAIGFTPAPDTWKSWEDNPYAAARGGPVKTPEEMFTSPVTRKLGARRLRYIADRWGSSTRLLAIDLLNEPEWDGPIPESVWIPWAEEMSAAWRSFDPYGHLVTTGSVGLQNNIGAADERPWYASPRDDIVQWHLYGKEFYEPHAVAVEMSRKVDETYGFGKPVVCGEFAYGGEDHVTYDHTHDGIWSLVFSGAGALAHTAPQFQIDSDEPMTPARGAHFKVLSDLLKAFGGAAVSPRRDVRVVAGTSRAWSLATDDGKARAIWVLGPEQGYGGEVTSTQVALPAGPAGETALAWLDDVTGAVVSSATLRSSGSGDTVVAVPAFKRHIAAMLTTAPSAPRASNAPVTPR